MDGELRAFALFGRVVYFLVDAPNDVSQQSFFLLEYAFAEHNFSSPE
jgi:hypothetical protein